MNLLSSVILLASVVLTRGCAPAPGATNVARNGEASQVSDYETPIAALAKNAIDGISDTDFYKGSCIHTEYAKDAWWKVDLKQNYRISNVVLTNRMDCCPWRLMGAEVRVGNSPDNNNPVCGTVTSVEYGTYYFCCDGMEGQYVSVVIAGRSEYLTVCEVEVYGDLIIKEKKVCW
ncbi:fucolectin-like [Ranitomeya imitator]|uniref:fucolectin-like n=1 Tax=Ranitomeya imitator TaxID=111125 RepID=UPI0037E8A36A